MSEIQIGLSAIVCHIALPMLVGVERSWVNIDIGIKFLDGGSQATGL